METPKPKPKKPRKPANRKPEEPKPLTEKELDKLPEIADEALYLAVDQQACVHLAMEYSKEHAATVLGWRLAEVEETLALPHVRYYAIQCRDEVIKDLARTKVRAMRKAGVSRATVEDRLMELAQLDPKETKGSIEGQVKALRTLAEIIGLLEKDDPFRGKTREDLEGFVKKAAGLLPSAVQQEQKEQQEATTPWE